MSTIIEQIREKRAAWLAEYNAATPERQAEMLAEKEREQKRAEEERKRRIYEENRDKFFSKANRQIAAYQILEVARSVAQEVVKSFDGKVLNNRCTKAVEERLKKIRPHLCAELTIKYDYDLKDNIGLMKITDYGADYELDKDVSFYIYLTPVTDSNRVDWSKTAEHLLDPGKFQDLGSYISVWRKSMKEYDKHLKRAEKLMAAIKEYGEACPWQLREHFKDNRVVSNYAFYL